MRYVEFTQCQDIETLLTCFIHAFHYVDGVTERILTDNMKSVVLDRPGDEVRWNPRFLDFATYYGFLPRVCHPCRPQTKGKIERPIEFARGNFWSGLSFTSLEDLNRQARAWMEEVNHRPHSTTRETPYERLARENLHPVAGQPDYDTSYVAYRQVAKDCLVSYRGNRYSVSHPYAGKAVVVKEPVGGGLMHLYYQHERIAEHRLAPGKGAIVIQNEHYRRRIRRPPGRPVSEPAGRELTAGPGVGRHHAVPEVEVWPLAVYEEVNHVAAI